ncbi:MAG: hypothetical protein LBS48_04050 [Treponema sp.]|jgi:hypothetical protein|nr:hypothetical protein [Treponema sp.]
MASLRPWFKQIFSGNPLKPVGLAGLLLALILSWALVFYSVARNEAVFPQNSGSGSSFALELEKYDALVLQESPASLDRRLNRLEKRAKTQEEQLSILKRRRERVRGNPGLIPGYQKAAREAAEAYPYSAPLAAAAAEALLLSEPGPEDREFVLACAARLTQPRYASLLLSLHVLLGSLAEPEKAVSVPGMEQLLSAGLARIPARVQQDLRIDETLLRIILGDPGAAVRISSLIQEEASGGACLKLGAEYFYDHNSPMRAAELFSRLGDAGLGRQADSLFLAGETAAARNIWRALASPSGSHSLTELSSRSLYNLAATAADNAEAVSWLEKLFAARTGENSRRNIDGPGLYGIIRYTRLQDTSRSIAILDEGTLRNTPLLDLELLRRRLDTWQPDRSAAEVWLLLGRHPESEALYQWGAYYFDRQKRYAETAQLLKVAAAHGIKGAWMDLHRSLALIREGKSAEAEKLLKDALAKGPPLDWRIPANIARIQESRRAIQPALDAYGNAAALVRDSRDAALVQMRISRCLEALGRRAESRSALERALALDPENLNARYELRRMDASGVY